MTPQNRTASWKVHPWVTAGRGAVRVGIGMTSRAPTAAPEPAIRLVRAVEELAFDSFWLADHPSVAADCWLTLAALAPHTTRLYLGPLVSCVYYRPPAMLARHAADVDRLSAGRAVLGLGAGWVEREFEMLGIPFPPLPERQRMLRETIRVVRGLWASKPVMSGSPIEGATEILRGGGTALWSKRPFTHQGQFAHFERAGLMPGPVQQPRVPILIGGAGEQVTFRLVARYADAVNIEGGKARTGDEVRAKLAALRQRFDEAERPFDTVLPSYLLNAVVLSASSERAQEKAAALPYATPNAGTPDQLVERLRPIVDAGMPYFILNLTSFEDLETAELLAERVLPALQPG